MLLCFQGEYVWASPNLPAYSTGVVNDCNIIDSGIKHEPPEHPAYSKGVVNDCNIIERGIKQS